MAIVIDRAEAADASGLRICVDAAYAPYTDQGISLPDVSGGIEQSIASSFVWVAKDPHQIIGGLILSVDGTEAYLENIAIHPDHGGKGIARQLLETANTAAVSAGCNIMKLTTHSAQPQNVALYQHLGWRLVRTQGEKVAMERDLTPG